MKISTKGRYALRFMIYLANHGTEGPVSLKDVSIDEDISLKYLEQIVSILSKNKLIRGIRGASGGYLLLKPASDYKIGDILEAVEGNLAPVACLKENHDDCDRQDACTTIQFWQGLNKVIRDYLNAYTLEDLSNMDEWQYWDFVI